MPEELYADTITGIALTGSVVRIDFASFAVAEDDSTKPQKPMFRQRVIMPVEGFVQSFGTMARVMQQLEQKGLVRRADQPAASRDDAAPAASRDPAPAAARDGAPVEAAVRPSSPNFRK